MRATMFFAHSLENEPNEDNWQRLEDHLKQTALIASTYARDFGAEKAGELAGLLHDLGKYSEAFQRRLHGGPEKVDHAIAGAKELFDRKTTGPDRLIEILIAYAISGHHAGLPDFERLNERLNEASNKIDPNWINEIGLSETKLWPSFNHLSTSSKEKFSFQLSFLGRMLFSCLVDADYKDTEAFYSEKENKQVDRIWPKLPDIYSELCRKLDYHRLGLAQKAPASELNTLRQTIFDYVCQQSSREQGFFTLTVPTGGGKTLTSLGFALKHAQGHNLQRIIYAIPFTSIIDQTVSIFRKALGEEYILEHHASIEEGSDNDYEQKNKLRLAMEDWAAPIVVTTNVQLFESLFANRSSKCRKLHNLANSIIILDEAQTLPSSLLRPCLAALEELTLHYGVTVLLCTATQPALSKKDFKHGGLPLEGRELAPNPTELASKLKRVTLSTNHVLSDSVLVQALSENEQALIIVNSRAHALALYQRAEQENVAHIFHLSTRQCSLDRKRILQTIRERLRKGQPCRLVATSLIEAGVDIDFPRVWRAEAGLDQIAQAAGRCNREGTHSPQESQVIIFKSPDHKPPLEIRQLAEDFYRIASKHSDLLSPNAFSDYFNEVYWRKGPKALDKKKIFDCFSLSNGELYMNYKTAADDFRMIDSHLVPVIIDRNEKTKEVIEKLSYGGISAGQAARLLQPYLVQIPKNARNEMLANGRLFYVAPKLWGDQFVVLSQNHLYTIEKGLLWEESDSLSANEYMF